jgi:hypothetical protein
MLGHINRLLKDAAQGNTEALRDAKTYMASNAEQDWSEERTWVTRIEAMLAAEVPA